MTNQRYPFFLQKSAGSGVFLRSYAHHDEVFHKYPRTTIPTDFTSVDIFRREAVPAVEKFFKIYILHKLKIFAFHRLYCFRLVNGKPFHQPAEFPPGQRSGFRSVAGPLELSIIQALLQEHESIPVEAERFHRIFLRPQNRKTALEKGSIWKLSRMTAMSPSKDFLISVRPHYPKIKINWLILKIFLSPSF